MKFVACDSGVVWIEKYHAKIYAFVKSSRFFAKIEHTSLAPASFHALSRHGTTETSERKMVGPQALFVGPTDFSDFFSFFANKQQQGKPCQACDRFPHHVFGITNNLSNSQCNIIRQCLKPMVRISGSYLWRLIVIHVS